MTMVSVQENDEYNHYDNSNSEDYDSESSIDNKLSTKIAKTQGKLYSTSQLNTFQHFKEHVSQNQISRKRTLSNDSLNYTKKRNSFSKNALMAREHRQKKKMYMQNLEKNVDKYRNENKKLTSILDNQSTLISDLRREVKYLKSILANKTEISVLLKSINQNTGLPVTTSLNKNLKMTSPKTDLNDVDLQFNENLNELNDFPIFDDHEILSCLKSENEEVLSAGDFNDHNYTRDSNDEFGVCLHIARKKVSLEFCAVCSENANEAWDK